MAQIQTDRYRTSRIRVSETTLHLSPNPSTAGDRAGVHAGNARTGPEEEGTLICIRSAEHPRWNEIIDERNLAALELLRLTGDQKWHEHFAEDSVLTESTGTTDRSQIGRERDAAFLYARLPDSLSEPRMATAARQSILNDAESSLAFARQNAWGFASSNRFRATGSDWFSTPDLIPLMRAHFLSDRPEFRAAFVRGVLFSVGANPMNMTYTTGVGHEWPQNAMVLDSRRTARAVPEGITVFGQVDYADAKARNSK